MTDTIPAWSVVVLVERGLDVVAVTRSFNVRNPALPGGDSDLTDTSPAMTAIRKLYEETGLRAESVKCIDKWDGDREQQVYAFLATKWAGKIRPSDAGKPFWTGRKTLLRTTAQFHADAKRVFAAASSPTAKAV